MSKIRKNERETFYSALYGIFQISRSICISKFLNYILFMSGKWLVKKKWLLGNYVSGKYTRSLQNICKKFKLCVKTWTKNRWKITWISKIKIVMNMKRLIFSFTFPAFPQDFFYLQTRKLKKNCCGISYGKVV